MSDDDWEWDDELGYMLGAVTVVYIADCWNLTFYAYPIDEFEYDDFGYDDFGYEPPNYDDDYFGGSAGNGGNGNSNNNNTEQFFYALDLSASGNGSVSPAGITNYAIKNTTVLITATPNNSLTVFGGWFEGGTLIGNESRHSITISNDRCITGMFYLAGDPCGELATKYRANTRLNNDIDNVLRNTLAPQNPNKEVGYLVTNTLGRENQPPGALSQMDIHFVPGKKYIELSHYHPGGTITPSASDLRFIYTAYEGNRMSNPNGFIFNIVTNTEILSIEVENIEKFKAFVKREEFDTDANFDTFKNNYRENIIKVRDSDYHINSTDRATKWLLENDSGLKFAKAKTINGENDWKALKLQNGKVETTNCNGI